MTERYVSRIMRLAFLAPDIVEAILDAYQPVDLELERLLKGIPTSWDAQRRALGVSRGWLPRQLRCPGARHPVGGDSSCLVTHATRG